MSRDLGDDLSTVKFNSPESVANFIINKIGLELAHQQSQIIRSAVETAFEFVLGDNLILMDKVKMLS